MNHDVPHYHRITIQSREPNPGGSTLYGWVDCDGNCLAIERRLMTRRVRIENVGVVRATRIERGKVKTTHDWAVEDVLDKMAADDIVEQIQKKEPITIGSWVTFKQQERWNDGVVREIFQGIPVFYEIVATDKTVHQVPAENIGVAIFENKFVSGGTIPRTNINNG